MTRESPMDRHALLPGLAAAAVAAAGALLAPSPAVPYAPWSGVALAAIAAAVVLLGARRSAAWVAASTVLLILAAAAASGPRWSLAGLLAAALALFHGEAAHARHRLRQWADMAAPEGAEAAERAALEARFGEAYLGSARRPLIAVAATVVGAGLAQRAVALIGWPAALAEGLEFQGAPGLAALALAVIAARLALGLARRNAAS